MKRIAILTGAGISAESGIKTFRDANGLWEGHDIMEVASPQGWKRNPKLVLDFYNKRRAQLKLVEPNAAHTSLVELESKYNVQVITQNVDDLHERAGSSHIIHLHGELKKIRSQINPDHIEYLEGDLHIGHKCPFGGQLRPHIVWFGESVPKIQDAATHVSLADIIVIIGSSMQVYPAAGLTTYAPDNSEIYYIDAKPTINFELQQRNINVIAGTATKCVPELVKKLLQ